MSDSFFTVTRHGKPPRRRDIRINGSDASFWLKTDPIENGLVRSLTPDLIDLLEIACAVFLADTSARRGGDTRNHGGADWYRQINFDLKVRNPDLWSRQDVTDALTDAVEFLTGDRLTFRFSPKPVEPVREPYLPLESVDGAFNADEVILFSGGLDSFAGALDALTNRPGNIILVTHRSAPKAITRQVHVGEFLKEKFGSRVLHLHVKATRAQSVSSESTQRSRSFLFASLAHAVARMADAPRISFYENGVVSHNLPISPQVIGTMASRTTHPLALRKLQRFLDLLHPTPIEIRNEYQWLTKTEVLRKIHELNGSVAISRTVSCTTLRNETSAIHHCGSCSQCLDRRFAILAADLEEYDRAEDYMTDVITGPRETTRSRTMALEWTRHACTLAETDVVRFAERFISDLLRIAQAYPDRPQSEIVQRIFDLQRRHGGAVVSVLERMIARQSAKLARNQLASTSLLALFIGTRAETPHTPDALLLEDLRIPPGPQRSDGHSASSPLLPLRVAFFEIDNSPAIEVDRLGCVRFGPAGVAHDLKPQYDEDLAAGLAPENHRYVPTPVLSRVRRHVSRNTVAQMVRRCRKELAELYAAIEQAPPEKDLLIENKRNAGYRLDPTIRVIRPDQIRDRDKG